MGWSGSVFKVSSNIFDGIATLPSSFDSTDKDVVILVCKSVAETVKTPLLISKRKFSRIGSTVLLLEAPLTARSCFNKVEVETINLIFNI
jgi:hypothetical protein